MPPRTPRSTRTDTSFPDTTLSRARAEHRKEMKPKRAIDERAPAHASAGFREAISVSRECQFDCLAPSLLVHVDRIGALTNQRENSYRLHSRGGGCPRRAVTTDRVEWGFGFPSAHPILEGIGLRA